VIPPTIDPTTDANCFANMFGVEIATVMSTHRKLKNKNYLGIKSYQFLAINRSSLLILNAAAIFLSLDKQEALMKWELL